MQLRNEETVRIELAAVEEVRKCQSHHRGGREGTDASPSGVVAGGMDSGPI